MLVLVGTTTIGTIGNPVESGLSALATEVSAWGGGRLPNPFFHMHSAIWQDSRAQTPEHPALTTNLARLHLFALACNLANFLRQLTLPRSIMGWTLTTLREKLIKIEVKVVRHSKVRRLAAGRSHSPQHLFAQLRERIARLCPALASG